jgi:hypothetical protein
MYNSDSKLLEALETHRDEVGKEAAEIARAGNATLGVSTHSDKHQIVMVELNNDY